MADLTRIQSSFVLKNEKNILCTQCRTVFNPIVTKCNDFLEEKSRFKLVNNFRMFLCNRFNKGELKVIFQEIPNEILSLSENIHVLNEFGLKLLDRNDTNQDVSKFFKQYTELKYPNVMNLRIEIKQFFILWSTELRFRKSMDGHSDCPTSN